MRLYLKQLMSNHSKNIPSFLRNVLCVFLVVFCAPLRAETEDPKIETYVNIEEAKTTDSYMPEGFLIHSSYVSISTVEFSLLDMHSTNGDEFRITEWIKIYFGFDPLHISIDLDHSKASDEAIFSLGGGIVIGIIAGLVEVSGLTQKLSSFGDSSFGKVLAYIFLGVPLYVWCGNLYIPLVSKSWLGLTDQSHILTHVFAENGFHLRSFTYVNDVGLCFSPYRSNNGNTHGYIETGVRFEKNFADKFKTKFFLQLGFSSTSK